MSSTGAASLALRSVPQLWKWVRDAVRRRDPIEVIVEHVDLRLNEEDEGEAVFYLRFVNFSRKTWELDHIELHYWGVNARSLPDQTHHLVARGEAEKRNLSRGGFKIRLDTAGVRAALKGIEPASHTLNYPRADLKGRAEAIFRRGRRQRKREFEFQTKCETQVPENLAQRRLNGR